MALTVAIISKWKASFFVTFPTKPTAHFFASATLWPSNARRTDFRRLNWEVQSPSGLRLTHYKSGAPGQGPRAPRVMAKRHVLELRSTTGTTCGTRAPLRAYAAQSYQITQQLDICSCVRLRREISAVSLPIRQKRSVLTKMAGQKADTLVHAFEPSDGRHHPKG